MKVIFLDFDGVLNNTYYLTRFKRQGKYDFELDPENMYKLFEIVDNTHAKIVLISSWRFTSGIKEFFKKYNLEIYDILPRSEDNYRPDEIYQWLVTHKVENYLILDDESSGYSKEQMSHAIITKECYSIEMRMQYPWYEGLQDKHIKWAIQMLNNPMDFSS